MDRRAWLLLLALAAIWGSSYLFIKIAVEDVSPATVAWGRVTLAALILASIAAGRGVLGGMRGKAGWLVAAGAVQVAGPFWLIGAGEQEISSSLAGILVASAPLFTALLAIWIDHSERASGLRLAGILLGVVGVALLLGVDLGGSGNELIGGLAVVLAASGYALGGFIVKHRLSGHPPIGIAAWVMIASSVLLFPAAALTAPDAVPGAGPIVSIAVLGVVGTGLAFAIFYDLIAQVGASRSLIVTYLAPGFAVVYGAALLDEAITPATVAGLALILAGSWLAAEGRLPGRRLAASSADPGAQGAGDRVAVVPDPGAQGVERR